MDKKSHILNDRDIIPFGDKGVPHLSFHEQHYMFYEANFIKLTHFV